MAPTLSDLHKLRRFRGESIKNFAHRFREMAEQIKPAMQDRDLITEFRDGLIPTAPPKPTIRPKPKELIATAEHSRQSTRATPPPTSYASRLYVTAAARPPAPVVARLRAPAPVVMHQQPKPAQQERPRRRLEDLTPTPDPLDVMFTRLRDMGFVKPFTLDRSIGYLHSGNSRLGDRLREWNRFYS